MLIVAVFAPAPASADATFCRGSSWAEADTLFRSSNFWLGADSAFSVALGDERTLWLFGDTWIDTSGGSSRDGATMIRNSVGLQRGTDPSRSTIEFYWDGTSDEASAYFASPPDQWYWPGHGIRVGDKVLVFLNRMEAAPGDGLGFRSAGWDAVFFENIDEDPSAWRIRRQTSTIDPMGMQLGFASVLEHDGYLFAFGTPDADKSHPVHAARWPIEAVEAGDLFAIEWWTGIENGWAGDVSSEQSQAIFEGGQSELTIHYDEETERFIAVHTVGFGPAHVAIRSAQNLTGPWTSPQRIYSPPELSQENIMIYAGKAHPQLQGADLVLTYATNTFVFAEHFSDPSTYYPHFVRLGRCALGVHEN